MLNITKLFLKTIDIVTKLSQIQLKVTDIAIQLSNVF